MDNYLRQQFDVLLAGATEAFLERCVQRCAGQDNAYARLKKDPNAEGVWLPDFIDALFAEHCLDTPEGAAFVLSALHRRTVSITAIGVVGDVLVQAAKQVFGELLRERALESLARSMSYN